MESNKREFDNKSLTSTEKKAPLQQTLDIGSDVGALSVTELAERWELNKTYSSSISEADMLNVLL